MGAWSWGAGAAGGDQVFGNHLIENDLKPVFDKAMELGLNLWDTAAVYGEGSSERILGNFVKNAGPENVILSTKFTPQIADGTAQAMQHMIDGSKERLHTEVIDLYWIHNPMDVERWTPDLIPLLKSGQVKAVGVSNHNLSQIKRANEILGAEGFRVSAVQNHFSLLHRSSERAGILSYCKENHITFFAYMVLEQGALTGRFDTAHPFPAGTGRGEAYNTHLKELEPLIAALREVGCAAQRRPFPDRYGMGYRQGDAAHHRGHEGEAGGGGGCRRSDSAESRRDCPFREIRRCHRRPHPAGVGTGNDIRGE